MENGVTAYSPVTGGSLAERVLRAERVAQVEGAMVRQVQRGRVFVPCLTHT